jgi:hypothetical protein
MTRAGSLTPEEYQAAKVMLGVDTRIESSWSLKLLRELDPLGNQEKPTCSIITG